MAGRVFKVSYGPSPEDSHDAFILAVGNEKNMEKQRNAVPPDVGSLGGQRVTLTDPSVTAEQTRLKEVLVELEAKNAKLEQMLDAAKMVKRLKNIIETMEETTTRNVEPAAEVDIGNGVTVPKAMLDKWRAMCPTPPRFARALLRTVFTADELEGCSLFGQPSNLRPGCLPKPALDKRRVDAVISYTCSIFNTTDTKVKASLATMLSKRK